MITLCRSFRSFRKAITHSHVRTFSQHRNRCGGTVAIPKGYSDSNLKYVMQHQTLSGLPNLHKPFLVLGIETSCDDTGVAVVRSDGKILSNIVYNQGQIHEKYGGIVPTLAMEAHKSMIDVAVEEAIKSAGLSTLKDIDAVAVTKGPGLEICLRIGCRKAQSIARQYRKPFVTVHHLEAHCLTARLAGQIQTDNRNVVVDKANDTTPLNDVDNNNNNHLNSVDDGAMLEFFQPKISFPFLTLLVSGGHTSIMLCHDIGQYSVLGGTLDDALGETLDKSARMLGLPTGGGAAIEKEAAAYYRNNGAAGAMNDHKNRRHMHNTRLTRALITSSNNCISVPMRGKPGCNFSFAGLKNQFRLAVLNSRQQLQQQPTTSTSTTNAPAGQHELSPSSPVTLPSVVRQKLCADIQDAAFLHLQERLKYALQYVDNHNIPINAVVVAGGVAANMELRRRLFDLLALRATKIKLAVQTTSGDYFLRYHHEQQQQAPPQQQIVSSSHNSNNNNNNNNRIPPVAPVNAVYLPLVFPPPALCTDNGVMVAWAGIEKLYRGISDDLPTLEQEQMDMMWHKQQQEKGNISEYTVQGDDIQQENQIQNTIHITNGSSSSVNANMLSTPEPLSPLLLKDVIARWPIGPRLKDIDWEEEKKLNKVISTSVGWKNPKYQ